MGNQPFARPQRRTKINAHRHPSIDLDLKPRPKHSSARIFTPQTVKALLSHTESRISLPQHQRLSYAKDVLHVRLEVFTAVTMKNGVYWDIKTLFLPHRRHITFPSKAQPVNAIKI
jgi:hypothetical protein